MRGVIIVISFLLFTACSKDDICREDFLIDGEKTAIEVERLDQRLFALKSVLEVTEFLKQNRDFATIFLHSEQYPNDSILAARIFNLIGDSSIDTLYREAQEVYRDMTGVTAELETALGNLQQLFPDTPTPEVQTAVTGLYNDLFISDSLIIIGIDFFIGDEASYKPLNIPDYILKRYDREHLSSIIVKLLAGKYVNPGPKNTLLSEMIDFGKTYFLTARLLPCVPDSILLGYTPKDMRVISENEAIIWANFVENEILYETSHITKRRFLGERPNVYEISQECPGRIGAWVGWQIVESYMRNNPIEITELLNEKDNNKIFMQSKYKPQTH